MKSRHSFFKTIIKLLTTRFNLLYYDPFNSKNRLSCFVQVPKLIEGREYIIRIMAQNIYGISDPLLSAETKARDIFSKSPPRPHLSTGSCLPYGVSSLQPLLFVCHHRGARCPEAARHQGGLPRLCPRQLGASRRRREANHRIHCGEERDDGQQVGPANTFG